MATAVGEVPHMTIVSLELFIHSIVMMSSRNSKNRNRLLNLEITSCQIRTQLILQVQIIY